MKREKAFLIASYAVLACSFLVPKPVSTFLFFSGFSLVLLSTLIYFARLKGEASWRRLVVLSEGVRELAGGAPGRAGEVRGDEEDKHNDIWRVRGSEGAGAEGLAGSPRRRRSEEG